MYLPDNNVACQTVHYTYTTTEMHNVDAGRCVQLHYTVIVGVTFTRYSYVHPYCMHYPGVLLRLPSSGVLYVKCYTGAPFLLVRYVVYLL